MPRSDSRISRSSSTTRMLDILRLSRGGGFPSQRKFHDELGAGGFIFFHANGAVVIFDDAAHDGQPQTGAALLGGEIRKEEPLLHVPADAGSAVSDRDFHCVPGLRQ